LQTINQNFDGHLQDVSKLAEHLKPLISEHPKIFEVLQQLSRRVSVLEKKNSTLEENTKRDSERIEQLEIHNGVLEDRVETLEKENGRLVLLHDKNYRILIEQKDKLVQQFGKLDSKFQELKTETNTNHSQMLTQLEDVNNMATVSSSKTALLEKSSDSVKQVEEKVLEVERTLNVLSVHHSELELQLQASLASTHNGAFLWRIPEVR